MNAITSQPLFGVAVTVIAYAIGQQVHRRLAWLPPLVTTCGLLIALLLLARIPLEDYRRGGDLVSFFLGPATIALGVPLYKQFPRIRRHASAVLVSIAIGAITSITAAVGFAWLGHGSALILRSLVGKGVTTPIAMEVARQIGGLPELTAVFAVLGGLLGSMVGPRLLRATGIRSDLAIGLAMGTSSHGIGTARAIRDSELQAGASGLAMAVAGILTSIVVAVAAHWLAK